MKEIDDITQERAARGDAAAFEKLYAFYSPFVWRLCFRSSNGDSECARELMQDTFVKVHKYLRGFEKNSALSTWLYKITYSCINEYFSKAAKRRARTTEFDEEYMGGTRGDLSYEDKRLVQDVLETLDEQERFLLTAREVDGMPYEELAAVTGETAGALRTRMARIKADIRKRIEKMDA